MASDDLGLAMSDFAIHVVTWAAVSTRFPAVILE